MKPSELQIPSSFSAPGLTARYLSDTDQPVVFTLLRACDDFSLLSTGKLSTKEDARDLLHDVPPETLPDQKAVIGFFDRAENLVAVLDFVIGYPDENTWFIGLLLIHPDYRSCGLGQYIVSAFTDWSSSHQAKAIMLGVLECNAPALQFWQANGFEEVERTSPRTFGLKEHIIITMKIGIKFSLSI